MNELIKSLAEQAWAEVSDEERENGELYEADKQRERRDEVFVELILQECLNALAAGNFISSPSIADCLRSHFGIEYE
jgi:hypothetical protein